METSIEDKTLGKCRSFVEHALLTVSFGQFKPKLYFRNQDQHSTIFGGVISLICSLIICSYAVAVLWDTIVTKDNRSLSEEIMTLTDSNGTLDFTVGDYMQAMGGFISI